MVFLIPPHLCVVSLVLIIPPEYARNICYLALSIHQPVFNDCDDERQKLSLNPPYASTIYKFYVNAAMLTPNFFAALLHLRNRHVRYV